MQQTAGPIDITHGSFTSLADLRSALQAGKRIGASSHRRGYLIGEATAHISGPDRMDPTHGRWSAEVELERGVIVKIIDGKECEGSAERNARKWGHGKYAVLGC